jgi:amidohydrolase
MRAEKRAIVEAVDRLGAQLDELSRRIHDHPELGYEEVRACGWLSDFLTAQGFAVERGVAGVDTAFRATIGAGIGPTIAILCEYDALPGIGHACGHNVIATAGAGAGAALGAIRDRLPVGRLQVIGTPAEEGGGGKIRLIRGGVFKDVDCAIMIHGFDRTILHQDLLGIVRATFEFRGRAAHASADPWAGINALDAVIQLFNSVAMLRQQTPPDCRIHGIITDGGAAANVIPEHAAAVFYVRAPRLEQMWELYGRVVACAEGAARATGTTLTVTQHDNVYEPLRRNQTLLDVFAANMQTVGLTPSEPVPDRAGSSDVGNVSQVIPAIQPMVAIAPSGTAIHTRDFADAAVRPLARAGMLAAAKTMAMTAFDLLAPGRFRRPRRSSRGAGEAGSARARPPGAGPRRQFDAPSFQLAPGLARVSR